MFSPRTLMIAGVVLIAVALGSTGHGFWWLFALCWVIPHAGRGSACGRADGRRQGRDGDRPADAVSTPAGPGPTRDRHEALGGR